jgi:hypothetical protein
MGTKGTPTPAPTQYQAITVTAKWHRYIHPADLAIPGKPLRDVTRQHRHGGISAKQVAHFVVALSILRTIISTAMMASSSKPSAMMSDPSEILNQCPVVHSQKVYTPSTSRVVMPTINRGTCRCTNACKVGARTPVKTQRNGS